MNGGTGGKKKGCCYILSSGQSQLRAVETRNVQYRSMRAWNRDNSTPGKIKSGYFFCMSVLLFFSPFFPPPTITEAPPTGCHVFCIFQSLWRYLGEIFFGFEMSKKGREEVIWNPPKMCLSGELGTFQAQLLSVQWTMLLTLGQYGGWVHGPAGWFGFHGN